VQEAFLQLQEAMASFRAWQERLDARTAAHSKAVEAHLAERARLVKEDGAILQEMDAAQHGMARIRKLYGKFTAAAALCPTTH